MVDLPEKMSSYKILGTTVQKLIFGQPSWISRSIAKNAGIFGRDLGAKFTIKGP